MGLGEKWDHVTAMTLLAIMTIDMAFTLFALLKLGKRLRSFEREVKGWSAEATTVLRSRIVACEKEFRHLRIFPNFIVKPERRDR